ncbi:hypothetical protein [Paractinoplanes toevensis]|uniref:Uncharacterized protein n=1 Tax=Paractinoplanes toevensis TaxID=571911 RepID=A0A919T3W4_9ACTN|nr:hypothetical protein [Actinoplanes toevensis]GIM88748.1 hypothetical protein Ato02nite_005410 [Actinoplanes toevensis]
MPWPDSEDLELTARAAFGADLTASPNTWAWTDLSDRVLDTPITISPGVLVGARTTKTGSASGLQMLNDDGALTAYLASSPYYPHVDVGTPVELAVRTDTSIWVSDTFARTVSPGWGTADVGGAWGSTLSAHYSVSGGSGKFGASTTTASLIRLLRTHRDVRMQWDMSIAAVPTGASTLIGALLRSNTGHTDHLWAGCEMQPGGTVLWTIRTSLASTLLVVAQQTQTGLTYGAGTVLRCLVELVGDRLRCKAWLAAGTPPDGWAIDYTITDTVLLAPGAVLGLRNWVVTGTSNSLPNPVSIDNLVVDQPEYVRAGMYIADVRNTFRVLPDGTTHSVAQIKLGGVGTRLELRDAPEWSPFRRSIQQDDLPPIAYWPLEDKAGATSGASAFEDQAPMELTGPAVWDFDIGLTDDLFIPTYGTTSFVSLAAGARLSAPVPLSATGAWTVSTEHQSDIPSSGLSTVRLMEWQTTGGTHQRWALIGTATGHAVRAYNDVAGTTTDVITFATPFAPEVVNWSVSAKQNGGNIDCKLVANSNVQATASTAGTLGKPIRVTLNPDLANVTASVDPFGIRLLYGQVTVHDYETLAVPFYTDSGTGVLVRADRAWAYEAAHRRAERLCLEERIPFRTVGDPYTSGITQLNAQPAGAFQSLLQRTVDSDSGGLLIEDRFGYAHIPRTRRYNRPADLVVDMSTYRYSAGTNPDEVLSPQLRARTATRVTVERALGSAATVAADTAYRKRRGTIDARAELDVLYDSDCAPHASWRLHLSVDGQGADYPGFVVDLAANPDLVDEWLLCLIGARIQRTNQPSIAGSGVIDQVVDGYTETISRRAWTVDMDTSPAPVWNTGVWDSTTTRWDLGSSTMNATVAPGVTSIVVKQTLDEAWSPSTPYDLDIDGEQVTVTSMGARTGTGPWTQAATVIRAVNGISKTLVAGVEVHAIQAGRWGL